LITFSKLEFSFSLSEFDWFVAVCSIVSVVLLKLTNIGFPTNVKGINGRDEQIIFIRWNVSMMSVESLAGCA